MENNGYAFAKIQAKRERKIATNQAWIRRLIDAGDGFPFKCNKCPKQYSNSGTLHNHKTTAHSDLRKFKCDLCGKAYKLRMQLEVHKGSHFEKNLKCNLCPLMFKLEKQLKAHGDVHLGTKKYQCQTCLKMFTQDGSRKRHELTHADPKEKCDICERQFHYRTLLQRQPRIFPQWQK